MRNGTGDPNMSENEKQVKTYVRRRYGSLARRQGQSCCSSSANSSTGNASRLYPESELQELPSSVRDISLGCGNPTAIAELKPGEVVLDLGSGGGIDCFFAAKTVGPNGKVIGLDMTPSMINLAKVNAEKMGIDNVEFRRGEMEKMPVDSESVDVIISNCVVNLSPDKDAVFGEAFRVLKPGGRLCVSDIVVLGDLPPEVRASMEAWAGCVAGALEKDTYLEKIRSAGFVVLEDSIEGSFSSRVGSDSCCGGAKDSMIENAQRCLVSVAVKAQKPMA